MPRTYQIIPQNSFPTEETYVNDNTIVTATEAIATGAASFLIVMSSPKGEDGVMKTFTGNAAAFKKEWGLGPYSLYGQPLMTAYALANTGHATLQLLRVTATNAKYASITVCAKYKVGEGGAVTVKLTANNATTPLASTEDLASAYTAATEPDTDGFTEVKLFTIACSGKGTYGNNYRVSVSNLASEDRENDFKNYVFQIDEVENGTTTNIGKYHVCFYEDALVGTTSYFADSVIAAGTEKVVFESYPDGFTQIYNAYKTANTDSTLVLGDFDALLGINKYTRTAITNYTVDTTSTDAISIAGTSGIALADGNDGDLASTVASATRATTLQTLYGAALGMTTDPMIASKNKFPANILVDCDYSVDNKLLLEALRVKRGDAIAIYDTGLTCKTKSSPLTWVKTNLASIVDVNTSIDSFYGKIRDPYNQKLITLTSTYALAVLYATMFNATSNKSTPLADNDYGNLESVFIAGTVAPVYDETVDADTMNEMDAERINYARNNAAGSINRATQYSRQEALSAMSELSNNLLVLDIKRDAEAMCARKRYNFATDADIIRFNKDAELLSQKYEGQVNSIGASFDRTDWEKERSIVHLYIDLVAKEINKTAIIEIDVNKN